MRAAVIGDIHSNMYALQSVICDIKKRDFDFILCTGDLVGYSPFPNEVIDILKENNVLSIQGNYDKAIGNMEIICGCDYKEKWLEELAAQSVEYTNNAVTEISRSYMRNLPQKLNLKVGKYELVLVHGSPRRINESLEEDSAELFEVTKEMKEDILVCGHTHLSFYKIINGKHVINCGTVGKPVNRDPRASYSIIEVIDDKIKVDSFLVEYDVESAARAIEDCPELTDDFAEMLRIGSIYKCIDP